MAQDIGGGTKKKPVTTNIFNQTPISQAQNPTKTIPTSSQINPTSTPISGQDAYIQSKMQQTPTSSYTSNPTTPTVTKNPTTPVASGSTVAPTSTSNTGGTKTPIDNTVGNTNYFGSAEAYAKAIMDKEASGQALTDPYSAELFKKQNPHLFTNNNNASMTYVPINNNNNNNVVNSGGGGGSSYGYSNNLGDYGYNPNEAKLRAEQEAFQEKTYYESLRKLQEQMYADELAKLYGGYDDATGELKTNMFDSYLRNKDELVRRGILNSGERDWKEATIGAEYTNQQGKLLRDLNNNTASTRGKYNAEIYGLDKNILNMPMKENQLASTYSNQSYKDAIDFYLKDKGLSLDWDKHVTPSGNAQLGADVDMYKWQNPSATDIMNNETDVWKHLTPTGNAQLDYAWNNYAFNNISATDKMEDGTKRYLGQLDAQGRASSGSGSSSKTSISKAKGSDLAGDYITTELFKVPADQQLNKFMKDEAGIVDGLMKSGVSANEVYKYIDNMVGYFKSMGVQLNQDQLNYIYSPINGYINEGMKQYRLNPSS